MFMGRFEEDQGQSPEDTACRRPVDDLLTTTKSKQQNQDKAFCVTRTAGFLWTLAWATGICLVLLLSLQLHLHRPSPRAPLQLLMGPSQGNFGHPPHMAKLFLACALLSQEAFGSGLFSCRAGE